MQQEEHMGPEADFNDFETIRGPKFESFLSTELFVLFGIVFRSLFESILELESGRPGLSQDKVFVRGLGCSFSGFCRL